MNKKIMYCFSGTGNSLNAALRIANTLKNTEIISMRCEAKSVPSKNANVIGFVFPVYHWSLPKAVAEFIKQVEINPKAYIFAIATCGGWPVNVLNDFADLINNKGAVVSYAKAHNTVANYVVAYKPFPNPKKILPLAAKEIEIIANEIACEKVIRFPRKTIIKEMLRLVEKPFIKSLPKKDRNFVVSSNCISCGLCSNLCIVKNISMNNGIPTFHNSCAQCMGCIAYCPQGAIDYNNRTQKRKKYHHPNITANQLIVDKIEIP